jgi:hypothetical protein
LCLAAASALEAARVAHCCAVRAREAVR